MFTLEEAIKNQKTKCDNDFDILIEFAKTQGFGQQPWSATLNEYAKNNFDLFEKTALKIYEN